MAPLPVYASGRYVGEPPYASLLRRLGLFDAIEPPAVESRLRMGQFPVVLRNSNGPGGFPPLGRISDDLARDSSRIIESLGDAVGETTRWAVGGLFGHLRDAMDHIESRVLHEASISRGRDYRQSSSQKQAQSTTEIDAGFDRLPSEESDNGRDSYRFYQVTTRTMPDGSIETRKVVRGDGGLEETTVTRHFPESERDDEVTFITDSLSSQQLPGDNNEN
ncbi:hypothetical protein COEREDRAFT_86115 [Coemansia reversa NRRL 1564]|uniref:Uncharacterized protein n=1 Tax=Coemansia reversa (strain ATCC 12441 / NRRL 1564) TaxID=763665 RepID=A0A2G5BEQ7_COERN|nr:hypothetical protein COEREDRAFT_86115 [Coemansia reversa NRRL 1564]|eukprot:PIA17494.1 hypothetical protein COEREDRAFT_86115 [Coemansia reversa NRRL 1564]